MHTNISAHRRALALLEVELRRTLPMARLEIALLSTARDARRSRLSTARAARRSGLPDCKRIAVALINADFPLGPLPADVMRAVIETPAYWAFCWGSGLGLARWLFEAPHWVAGRHVIDFGSGSGIVAIAAALNGAARVTACDLDPNARAATQVNAELNDVAVHVVPTLADVHADVLLMADVLYDATNVPLLDTLANHAATVVVADSRVRHLPSASYRLLTTIDAATLPNLGEFDEFSTVRIWANR